MRSEYHPAMTRAGNVLASVVGALGLVALLTAGCSSDEAATATTAIAPTTIVETTPLPPATDPTTTEPATTTAPTTTLDPATTLAAEVEADFLEAFAALYAVIQDPSNETLVSSALDWHIGSNRVFIAEQIDEYRLNGWVARPHPEVAAAVIVEVPAAAVEPSDDFVELQICEVDSWIVVEPGAGPDGGDAIVNDELNTYRSKYFVRQVDERWSIEGSSLEGSWLGLKTCPVP
jgi:hypothetical protein